MAVMLRVGMQVAALRADISGALVICQEIKAEKIILKLCRTTGTLKISVQSATDCIPTRSMGTRKTDVIGRIHELGDGDLPGKFRLGDIRAERYTLHSHAEHGNEEMGIFSESPNLWIRPM